MATLAASTPDPYSLMRLAEAWRNWSGLRTLAVTFMLVAIVLALGGAMRVGVVMALTGVIAAVVLLLGSTAAGMQFMQQAAGRPITGSSEVLQESPAVLLRSLGLAAIVFAAMVVLVLAASALLALCRIPGFGELLYIAVLPLLTFAGALACVVLPVVILLAAPALWEGHSLKASLVHLWGVVTQRPFEAFTQLVLLCVAGVLVACILFLLVASGFGIALGLSAVVLSRSGDGAATVWDGMEAMSSAGSLYAGDMLGPGSIGAGIVMGGVVALFMAVVNLGLSLVYLNLTRRINFAAAEASFDAALSFGRRHHVPAAAPAAVAAAPAPAAVMPAQRAAANASSDDATVLIARQKLLACPACRQAVYPGDLFCPSCGHKLV